MKYYAGMELAEFIYKNYGFSVTMEQKGYAASMWRFLSKPTK